MKNSKWATLSNDDRDMRVVLFVSRPKDNVGIVNFKERRQSFITKESVDSDVLKSKFIDFMNNGVDGEMSRMYISVNTRDTDKVYKALLHFLIDNPDFNLCSIESKLAGIAATKENAKTKHWMFDFDIADKLKLNEFVSDIEELTNNAVDIATYPTPHGYAVIVDRGFDTRGLYQKWRLDEVTLKRDDLLCVNWLRKGYI